MAYETEVARLTPRARRHGDTLAHILDTAMGMVEEDGFAALSVNKLADAVDYTPGALYRYFGSKDELLSQLIERVLTALGRRLDAALARLPPVASPLARVLALTYAYRDFAKAEPRRFGLLAMSLAEPRRLLADDKSARPVLSLM